MGDLGYKLSSFATNMKIFLYSSIPCFVVQILVITALTMTKQTGVLNIASFTMVFVGYLISIFRYHEKPNLICFVGIVLIILGCTKTILFTKVKWFYICVHIYSKFIHNSFFYLIALQVIGRKILNRPPNIQYIVNDTDMEILKSGLTAGSLSKTYVGVT